MPQRISNIILALLLISLIPIRVKCAQPSTPTNLKTDLMYVIDVSGSMIGLPKSSGAEDIFPAVINALEKDIARIEIGSRVFVFTFAEGPHDVDGSDKSYQALWEKQVESATDKEEIKQYIRGLDQAIRDTTPGHGCGWNTAIYDAMKVALQRFDKLRETYDRTHRDRYRDSHIQRIVLLTDGRDNVSREWDFEKFLSEFKLRRAEDQMGDHILIRIVPLKAQVFTEEEKIEIYKTEGMFISEREKGKEIPPLIEPTFSITPSKIRFGGLTKGTTKRQEFTVKAENLTAPKNLNIAVEEINRELLNVTLNPSTVILTPGQPSATFTLELKAKKNLPWWRSLKVKILAQDPGETVAKAIVTLKGAFPLKIVGLIIGIIVIAGIAIAITQRVRKSLRERVIPVGSVKTLDFSRSNTFSIGQEKNNDLVLIGDDRAASRHAQIIKKSEEGKLTYRIQVFEKEIYVNDQPLYNDTKELQSGDKLEISQYGFEFLIEHESPKLRVTVNPKTERRGV